MSATPAPHHPPLISFGSSQNRVIRAVTSWVTSPIMRLLKIDACNDLEAKVARTATPETFFRRTLELLDCKYEVSESDLERIPAQGPVVVVSNHPLGGLDGIILGDLLRRRRPDVKLMANYLLAKVKYAAHHMIFVDPFPKSKPSAQNIGPLRDSLKHLKQGGLLGIFPGNRVSHYRHDRREVADQDWVSHIGALIRRSGATVVPIYIDANNSRFFSYAGMLHPLLRTLLLPREFIRRGTSGEPVPIRVGTPIPSVRLRRFETDQEMMTFLRSSTYMLSNRPKGDEPVVGQPLPSHAVPPVAPPLASETVEAELHALPPECCLVKVGDFEVYMGRYQQMPSVMHEIGRGREISFRVAGGGTLQPLDLSPQDEYYHHLLLWHKKDRVVVGAYRIGLADEILAKHGPEGLISSGLFEFKPEFIRRLNPGLELGRSYILPEYQRSYNSLLLLWSGILAFIAVNPQYKTIFGSVGVSQGNEYCAASRTLIVNFMRSQHGNPELSVEMQSNSPFEGVEFNGLTKEEISRLVTNIEDVSTLVTGLESDGKGIPVLIKHYTRMNAKLLDFGVWKNHSNAVVGFLIADLTTADSKFLRRYMGDDGYQTFRAFHGMEAPKKKRRSVQELETA